MNILVVGTGYVGLVTGACLAHMGFHVTNVDKDQRKIDSLRKGEIPISEAGLEDIVRTRSKSGHLSFETDLAAHAGKADIAFIAVGTPNLPDGQADLSAVDAVADQLGRSVADGCVIVVKSTVPAGTCERLQRRINARRKGAPLAVVSNPEFLREGSAVADFFSPDRIVIGTTDQAARTRMEKLYEAFANRKVPLVVTDPTTSELIKYAANGFLAMKITFINEMAHLCSALGADVENLARAIGMDPRIGSAFLKPGPGYGGSCFPKDVLALSALGHELNSPLRLMESVASANAYHVRRLFYRAGAFFGRCWNMDEHSPKIFAGRRIALLGLAFKANTDDIRESASMTLAHQLLREGASVAAYDPAAMHHAKKELPDLETVQSVKDALLGADGAVIMTEWKEFADFDWAVTGRNLMKTKAIVDFRNLLEPKTMAAHGYSMINLGRR